LNRDETALPKVHFERDVLWKLTGTWVTPSTGVFSLIAIREVRDVSYLGACRLPRE